MTLALHRLLSRSPLFLFALGVGLAPGCSESPGEENPSGGGEGAGTGGSSAPACQAGWVECPSGCADLSSDGFNCGACGMACPADQVCGGASCASSCPEGTTQCGQSCVNLQENAQHCGACNVDCGMGHMCQAATCSEIPTASGGATSTGGNGSGAAGSGGGVSTGGATGGGTSSGGGTSTGGTNGTGGQGSGGLPFLIGADITHTMQDEYWGATYTDAGVEKPLEVILKDHGFNAVRIDTFVDPSAPGGYAAGEPVAFRSLAQTITLAQRVKAQGMYFLLDLHMSDTWTNPGAQGKPNAWSSLSFADLEDAVYDYVSNAVTQLSNAGAKPDMVQIGNEITNGMLWDSGRITNNDFSGLANLLKAGISAVKDIDPNILVMLHIEKCNNESTTRWWLEGVEGEGVVFDVFGQSCYAATDHHAGYQGTPTQWASMFNAIAPDYPHLKFVVAEYSAEQRAANDVVFNLPNEQGLGTFNWDPTRFYETHPNDPLFEAQSSWSDFHVIPELMGIYDQMAADYAAAGR